MKKTSAREKNIPIKPLLYLTILIILFNFKAGIVFPIENLTTTIPGLSVSEIEKLENTGELTRFYGPKENPKYLPSNSLQKKTSQRFSGFPHKVGVESIFLLPNLKMKNDLEIYNALRKISSLKGITYYSESREKMHVLFSESHMISDINNRHILPDPIVKHISSESAILIYQKDSTFEESINKLVYTYHSGSFSLSLENILPLKISLFPIIDANDLKMNITIMQIKGFYLFHGICEVDVFSALGLAKRYEKNLYNRIKALSKWFETNISKS